LHGASKGDRRGLVPAFRKPFLMGECPKRGESIWKSFGETPRTPSRPRTGRCSAFRVTSARSTCSGLLAGFRWVDRTVDELGFPVVNATKEVAVQDPNAEPNPGASKEPPASDSPPATAGGPAGARADGSQATDEGAGAAASGVVTPAKTSMNGNPVVEWFWQGGAVKALLARGTTLTKRGQELLRRARLAHELGTRVLEPPEPLPSGNGDAIACELYRESIEWSLAAHQEQGSGTAEGGTLKAERMNWAQLWEAADPAFLSRAAGKGVEISKLREELMGRSFRDFADLDSSEQARLARTLRLFSEGLTNALDSAQNELDRLWLRRVVRMGGALLAVGLLILVVVRSSAWLQMSKDLAPHAEWTSSSVYDPEPGCKSPEQECGSSPNFFIATHEEDNPWLMFDLKSTKSLSGVQVENRLDCCYERAFPLVVEVSDDAKTWKEVARRTSDFSTWKTSFDTVQTRYVRFRILKRTNLHFSRVMLLP